MTESSLTQELLVELRGHHDIVTFKLSDRFTMGIPDIAMTLSQLTFWLEIKYARKALKELLAERSFKVQLEIMKRLEVHGRAMYVVYIGPPRAVQIQLWHPSDLQAVLIHGTNDEPAEMIPTKNHRAVVEWFRRR